MTTGEQPPRRLIESEGRAGEVLRRALSEEPRIADVPRFSSLQEKRANRGRRQGALLLAAAALAFLVGLRATRREEPVISVRAEPVAPTAVPASSAAHDAEAPRQALPSESQHPASREPATKPRVGSPSVPRARATEPVPVPSGGLAPAEVTPSAKPCAELARNGAVNDAMSCYDKLATGAGVTAELAFFEQARLAGKALRQPARALALLDQYRERFPRGSLRAEAMLARIEWSLASGDTALTRVAVDEALASGLLKERTEELTRLRASLDTAPRAQ